MRKLVRFHGCRFTDVVACARFLLLLGLGLQLKGLRLLPHVAAAAAGGLNLLEFINVSQSLVSQPTGVFNLGFYSLPTTTRSADAVATYSLAIWYAQDPTTAVWMASRDVNLSSSAYLQLSADGILRLFPSPQNDQAVWQSANIGPTPNNTSITAELEDNGNFVLKDAATNTVLWQSFDTPTDTLLPGQKIFANMSTSVLVSWKAADDWSSGYYQCDWASINPGPLQSLALSWTGASITNWNRSSWSSTNVSDRNATVYPYWWFQTYPADYAYLNTNGNFYFGNASGEWSNLTSTSDQGQGGLTRMTLDRDGGLRLYSLSNGNAASSTGWVVEGNLVTDSCQVFATCGVFAICSVNVTFPSYFSTCTCPTGFIPIDQTDLHKGCQAEYQIPAAADGTCINDTSKLPLIEVGDIDYPFADRLFNSLNVSETECKETCKNDCNCAGAVFHRRDQTCFIKGAPLFNGGYTVEVGNRSAYLKILTSPLTPSQSAHGSSVNVPLVAGICAAAAVVLFLSGWICLIGFKRHVNKVRGRQDKSSVRFDNLGLGPRNFTYKQLSAATRNFSDSELLGKGGMGSVYRGVLRPENVVVAVKRIRDETKTGEQGFLAEATSISQIRHRNLVQLQGWCYEDKNLLLVYDFMSNGSLDQWLYNSRKLAAAGRSSWNEKTKVLSWELRYSILSGVAAALAYLHEECQQCVLHRDIKPSNVMLDEKFDPHLGDFGLARLIDHEKVDKTTMMAGTLGYMAPEMAYTGRATMETDVYSFGILVLEVACGRHPLESWNHDIPAEDVMLVNRVRRAHEAGQLLSVVDPRLETLSSCNVATVGSATAADHGIKTSGTSTTANSDLVLEASQNMQEQQETVHNSKPSSHKSDSDPAAVQCSIKDDTRSSSFSEALNRRKEQQIASENEQKMRVLQLGILCSLPQPTARPSMRVVHQVLSRTTTSTSTYDQAAVTAAETLVPLPPLPPTFLFTTSELLDETLPGAAMFSAFNIQLQPQCIDSQDSLQQLQIMSDKQPLMSDRSVFSQEYSNSVPVTPPSP